MVKAQEWLDQKYSKEERDKITKLDTCYKNLEGDLYFTYFVNLKEL
jgi:hypothetical protein